MSDDGPIAGKREQETSAITSVPVMLHLLLHHSHPRLIPHHVCLLDMKQAVYFSTVGPFQTGLSTKKRVSTTEHGSAGYSL